MMVLLSGRYLSRGASVSCLMVLYFFSGCQTGNGSGSVGAGFRAVSGISPVLLEAVEPEGKEVTLVTMAAADVPLGQVMRSLATQTGVSLLWAEELDTALVSMEVQDVELTLALEFLARRLGVQLTAESGVYFLGDSLPEDRAVMVIQVGRLSPEAIRAAVDTVVTQGGEFYVLDDGVVVIAEKVGVLRKIEALLNQLEEFGGGGWMVQLLLVEASDTVAASWGIDTELDIEVSSAFASSSAVSEVSGTARAALKADLEKQRVKLYAQPLFLVLDGGEASLKRVQVVPVAQYTTIETGAVVTSGYSDIEIGLECLVKVRGDSRGVARVEYDVSLGEILGYVDDRVPVRTEETLKGAASMKSGGTYLLGSLERGRERSGTSGPLQLSRSTDNERSRLEVWAMVVELGTSTGVVAPEQNFSIDISRN